MPLNNCAPTLALNADAIVSAVVTVAERSFYAWAEPTVLEAVEWPAGPWWDASVSFDGPLAGRLSFALPDHLARQLLSSFLGLESDEEMGDAALGDFVGEFANMACGAWLTSLAQSECFRLQHPEVTSLAARPDGTFLAVVMVSDVPVVIRAGVR